MKKIKVAIADDSRELVQRIEEYFFNHPQIEIVATASNGKLCLEMLEQYQIDLLLLDIIMPHMDGIAVLEQVKAMPKYKDLSIIILTAFGHEDIMKHALALGATYLILKPFDFDQLESKILRWTGSTPMLTPANDIVRDTLTPVEARAMQLLKDVGIPINVKGYTYLRYAVTLVERDKNILNGSVMKVLYPEIAARHNTTASRVERAIRHAIEVAWSRKSEEICQILIKGPVETCVKPKNSAFIALIIDKIQTDLAQSQQV